MTRTLSRRIVLPLIAFYLYLTGSAPYLGQWDSFDYLKQIVTHQLSALGIGRPVYLGYNIALWESMKWLFDLNPMKVEVVAMAGTILLGVLGVVLFQQLAHLLLPSPACHMAALAFAISPVYAIYSGFIMTEVPMLVALIAAALILWKPGDQHSVLKDVAGGILFGLAVGIREQALTLGAAFLWILFSRRTTVASRLRSVISFGIAAGVSILAPALVLYLLDPAGFLERTRTWLHAIPMGSVQFRNNAEASLLYAFLVCPGAWIAFAAAGIYRLFRKSLPDPATAVSQPNHISNPVSGIFCCLVLPVVVLWRDADVQMHPRYVLLVLPAALIFCASLFKRWIPSTKGVVLWAAIQVLFFGIALAAFAPFRETQTKKIEFARMMRDTIPDGSLIIAGNYSPILDYYRGIGARPGWQIQWSGWDWNPQKVEATIQKSWSNHVPVYLSTDPPGWSYFEGEFLDIHFMLKDCKKEPIAPNLYRIYPSDK
jgi:hypothetical protein